MMNRHCFWAILVGSMAALSPCMALEPGFESLFDGKTLAGWKHDGNWAVEDGVIARHGKGGSLIYSTKKVLDDFELRFD